MLEDETRQRHIIRAAELGSFLLRNNSGGRGELRWGLGNISVKLNKIFKSSDDIGITPTIITQEMVGKTVGIFTAVESKREGWVFNPKDLDEVAQWNFIQWVIERGGFAGFAASVDDVNKIVGK